MAVAASALVSGAAFAQGVAALPYAIKPNLEELEELTERKLPDESAILEAIQELIDRGIGCVAVSMGPDGAIYVADSDNHCLRRLVKDGERWVVRTYAGALRALFGLGLDGDTATLSDAVTVDPEMKGATLLSALDQRPEGAA